MRHIFAVRPVITFPVVGDLIRSDATPGYINLVLEVIPIDRTRARVRSVRYGNVNGGFFKPLYGRRSRWIVFDLELCIRKIHRNSSSCWRLVDEYVPADNIVIRRHLVQSLKDVDTTWRPRNSQDQD